MNKKYIGDIDIALKITNILSNIYLPKNKKINNLNQAMIIESLLLL